MRHLASTALAFTFLLQTQSPSQSIRWIKHGGRISNMAVGGDYLVTTAHGTIHLWNAHDRAFMRSLPSVNRSFHGISADGTTLILQDYYSIHALDLPGGDLFSLPKAPDLEAVAYQARSNRLGIVHSDGAIRLFDIPSRQDLPHLLPALPGASALEFSPSGQHVAILLENSARLYSFATSEFVEISFAANSTISRFPPMETGSPPPTNGPPTPKTSSSPTTLNSGTPTPASSTKPSGRTPPPSSPSYLPLTASNWPAAMTTAISTFGKLIPISRLTTSRSLNPYVLSGGARYSSSATPSSPPAESFTT